MVVDQQTQAILALIHRYQDAVNRRDTDLQGSIFALEDEAFSEILYRIPHPIDSDVMCDILSWLQENPAYRFQVEYKDIEIFNLTDSVSYAVAINEWTGEEEEDSARVTFIFRLYDDGEWRIVHLHRSAIPNT